MCNRALDTPLYVLYQKQHSRGILKKKCSENMQQIYRRTLMPKSITLRSKAYFASYYLRYPDFFLSCFDLKVQSCKLCNNKYMIASTQITATEIFVFTTALVFKLLGRKFFFVNRKGNRNYQKAGCFLRKQQISRLNYCKIINSWDAKFLGCFLNINDHLSVLFQFT